MKRCNVEKKREKVIYTTLYGVQKKSVVGVWAVCLRERVDSNYFINENIYCYNEK